jgi:hypothetical protein
MTEISYVGGEGEVEEVAAGANAVWNGVEDEGKTRKEE